MLPYTLKNNITFTTKAGGKTTAFKAKKGDVLYLDSIYCKSEKSPLYVKLRNESGKSGWYKVPKKKFFKEDHAWG